MPVYRSRRRPTMGRCMSGGESVVPYDREMFGVVWNGRGMACVMDARGGADYNSARQHVPPGRGS